MSSLDLGKAGITIEFTTDRAAGRAPVNRYSGPYSATAEGALKLGPMVSTMMAGPDEDMRAESAYLSLLDTVTGYSVSGAELDLFADRQQVLIYTRSG